MTPLTPQLYERMFVRVRESACAVRYAERRRAGALELGAIATGWPAVRAALDAGPADETAWALGRLDAAPLRILLGLQEGAAGPRLAADARAYVEMLTVARTEPCNVAALMRVAHRAGELVGSGALTRLGRVDGRLLRMYAEARLGRPRTWCTETDRLRVTLKAIALLGALPTTC